MAQVRRFNDEVLTGLLRALRARNATHPDSPWLIAYWPGIPEEQMAAACGELIRRGHAIRSTVLSGGRGGAARSGWAVAAEIGSGHADPARVQ
jgi:hypothetical protein